MLYIFLRRASSADSQRQEPKMESANLEGRIRLTRR